MTTAPRVDRPRRVLLVDDEVAIRTAIKRYFQRRGWEVEEAADGQRALELLLAGDDPEPFDVIVSDIRMPRLSGEQLHDRLQRERPALLPRCIFSSGDVNAPEHADFLRRTHCRVLEKPFELARLGELADEVAGNTG